MSFFEFIIILVIALLLIKPEQIPTIIKLAKQVYSTISQFISQQEKQITQSSQLEWLNKKISKPKKSKKKDEN